MSGGEPPCEKCFQVGLKITTDRWLGFIIGLQMLLFFIDLGSFRLPVLSQFVTSQLFTVYAIILSTAKAVWFLSPQRRSR